MKKILFIVTLFIFCIGLYCFTNPTPDNDLWARLIAGSYIVENLSVAKFDFLSYTPTHPWYDHEWGASVFFYLALKYFGENGLFLLGGFLSALTVFFCYKTVEIRKPKSSVAFNILYYAFMFWIVSSRMGAVVRCLIFTCLFFSIFLYILERYRNKGGKCLILLPLLMLFWCNIHGGCMSGFLLLGIYIIGEFLNKKPVKPYIYTFFACIPVLFINPYGVEYVKFLFYAATMPRIYISEWFSPFLGNNLTAYLRYKLYLIFIIAVQIIYLLKNKINFIKLDKTKTLLILVFIYLSMSHLRHITFFIFTAGTLMYDEFYSIYNTILNKIKFKNEEINNSINLLKEIFVYVSLISITLPSVLNKDKTIDITITEYPRFAVEFIRINKIEGNLFINFDWGSYAAYKLYPNNLIVMDGRYEEVYNPDLLLLLKNFHLVKEDWYKIIRDYKTDVMIIEKKYPVFEEISKHPDWVKVFENDLSAVFVPKTKVRKQYFLPIPNDEYYNKNLFKSQFFKI